MCVKVISHILRSRLSMSHEMFFRHPPPRHDPQVKDHCSIPNHLTLRCSHFAYKYSTLKSFCILVYLNIIKGGSEG